MEASSATGTVDDDDDGGGGGAVEAAALEPLIGDAMILIVNGSCCGSLCLDASPVTKAKGVSSLEADFCWVRRWRGSRAVL